MLPYLWPAGRLDLRTRVVIGVSLLLLAKVIAVYVPIFLRDAVNALGVSGQDLGGAAFLAVPLGLLLAYGLGRFMAQGFSELRDAVFARVAQNAIREVALGAFRHLLSLSLRFHLDRQTGGLSRALERGAKSIEFLLFFVMFSIVPTIFEVLLVCGILWWLFDWRFVVVPLFTIAAYMLFTFRVTELRIRFRREMNDADNEAASKTVDALLNYETVKYFGNDSHEAGRYDRALASYQEASLPSTIEIRESMDPLPCVVLADAAQLQQVILNLAANASHAMRETGGVLTVSVEGVELSAEGAVTLGGAEPGSYVKIVVRDTGHGIEPDVLNRIYDPFFTTKAPGEGTGLGLSVVHGIVLSHGGALDVDSQPEKGTTFSVYLPRSDMHKRATPEGGVPVGSGSERVLFVDDEGYVAELGREVLSRIRTRYIETQ